MNDRADFRVFRESPLLIVSGNHENTRPVVGYVEQGVRNECGCRAVMLYRFEQKVGCVSTSINACDQGARVHMIYL